MTWIKSGLKFSATVIGAAGLVIGYLEISKEQSAEQPVTSTPSVVSTEADPTNHFTNLHTGIGQMVDLSSAAAAAVNGVVHVTNRSLIEQKSYAYNPFQHFFYGQPYQEQKHIKEAISSGSGVVISEDGYIVTNNHVIKNATEITIALDDKSTYEATLIGTDPSTDLALLKINAQGLDFIPFGDPDAVKIGQWVLAVGNPFNLNSTVTAGIVSAKGRDINILRGDQTTGLAPVESFIQTDAAVNPGNSGGALVNASGELIGINTAIKSNTGSYTGYSFAVPVSIVKKIVTDLVEFGSVQRAYLGVHITEVNPELAKAKSLKTTRGIYVNHLAESGAAQKAGMKPGDVITHIGNIEVDDMALFQEEMSKFRPGDELNVRVNRGGKLVNIKMQLADQHGATETSTGSATNLTSLLGAQLESISSADKKTLGIKNGLRVKRLTAGKLRKAGVKEGFVITKIDHQPIENAVDIANAIQHKKGGILIEGKFPSGTPGYFAIPM